MYFVFIGYVKTSDLTLEEIQKCKKDTIAFDGDNCVEKA